MFLVYQRSGDALLAGAINKCKKTPQGIDLTPWWPSVVIFFVPSLLKKIDEKGGLECRHPWILEFSLLQPWTSLSCPA